MWQWWSRRSGPQWKLGLCILRRRPWMVQDGSQRAGRSDLQCRRASATAGSIRHGDQGSGGSKRAGNDPPPPRRPTELQRTQSRRERIQHAMNHLVQDNRLTRVNLTGEVARLMKGRQDPGPGLSQPDLPCQPFRRRTSKRPALRTRQAGAPIYLVK